MMLEDSAINGQNEVHKSRALYHAFRYILRPSHTCGKQAWPKAAQDGGHLNGMQSHLLLEGWKDPNEHDFLS